MDQGVIFFIIILNIQQLDAYCSQMDKLLHLGKYPVLSNLQYYMCLCVLVGMDPVAGSIQCGTAGL